MGQGVAVIGEALVDIVVGGSEHPGGSPMNVAVGLARLGEPTVLHTRIGRDPRGDVIRTHLADAGVRLGEASLVDEPTWTATAVLDADGKAQYEFALGGPITVPVLEEIRLVHTGSIGALRAEEADAVRAAYAAADGSILRSFDPNIRADVMGQGARERVFALAAECQVVKLSDEDADWLRPGEDPRSVLEEFAGLGVGFAVVTRGGSGCLALVDGIWHERPAIPVTVVDTIGAGDAFMSGLLFGLVRDSTVDTALSAALASAAITVSRAGANPPHPNELQALLG